MNDVSHRLRLVRAGIDTYQQPVVYLHRDCAVCRAEGFGAPTRVSVRCGGRELVATLNVVTGERFRADEAALSDAAWEALRPAPAAWGEFEHAEPPASGAALRAKVFGERLTRTDCLGLMQDTVNARLSDLELAAFVAVCAGERLDLGETLALTQAMVDVGERINWGEGAVLDKHCVGGLPGNRTTPIVVAIVAAAGYRIPKTSSRAITSPAGTADTMEVMAPVDLDLAAMRRVVESEGGCIVWGGNVRLSPADDILIRIERPLDFDSDGQLVASILSKKVAAGATHVLIDMPVGPTAKVRSPASALALQARLLTTAQALGLHTSVLRTDGRQPVGFGIGPVLEACDVLRVLRGDAQAPADLRERSLDIAAAVLELAPGFAPGRGREVARELLDSGAAWRKFEAICRRQGGFTEPSMAPYSQPVPARRRGTIARIDNRRLARIAKLAGAPASATAGLYCERRIGDRVEAGDVLFEIHAQSRGELDYALAYAARHPDILGVGGMTVDRVLLAFPAQQSLAEALVRALKARVGRLRWRHFPDGESLVAIESSLAGADVAIVASLDRPDSIALALRFAAGLARELGARSVGLIAPYLAYLRQDKRFHPGEAVSASIFARFLADSFEWLVTVDPHLHRARSLSEWFDIPTANVAAAPAIAEWIRTQVPDALLIGPDAESAQWVSAIAQAAGVPWQVLDKVRRGDREVEVAVPENFLAPDRTPVLVDDIISTGRTQIEALSQLRHRGLRPAICVATHAVFAGDALERLRQAGARQVVTTDTIPHRTNALGIASLLIAPVAVMFQRMESASGDETAESPEAWFDANEPDP